MKTLFNFLSALLLVLTVSFPLSAQDSFESAAPLNIGSNLVTFSAGMDYEDSKYFSYTAPATGLLQIEGISSLASFMAVDAQGAELLCIERSAGCIVPLHGGDKMYIAVSPAMTLETDTVYYFTAVFSENENATRGTSASDPIIVREGETNITMDTAPGFTEFNSYFTFTAKEDGALRLSCSAYLLSARYGESFSHLSGSFSATYSDGIYVGSLPVEKGKTVCFCLSAYTAMTIKAEMTYPERGTSSNYPLVAAEGENEVSAEFGTYWYKYDGADADGYVEIASDYELPRGYVQVFNSDLSSLVASSESGSYNVRFRVSAKSSYIIYIYKPEESEEWPDPDIFTLTYQKLRQGESISNPIVLTPNQTVALESVTGTYYYSLTVPSGSNGQMIDMQVSGDGSEGSMLSLYDLRNGSYYAKTGYGRITMAAEAGHSYMLILTKQAFGQSTLLPQLRDMIEGEHILKPITATLGANSIQKASNLYFQYTATITGRIGVSFSIPGVGVEFPVGTKEEQGAYNIVNLGNQSKIDVVRGQNYYIHLSNISESGIMTLTEAEYQQGEVKDMAYQIDENTITLGSGMVNTWFRYIAPKSGKVILSTSFLGDDNTTVYYCTENSPTVISTNNTNDDGDIVYNASFPVSEGEAVYVHFVSGAEHVGGKIFLNIRDFERGETPSSPYELAIGKTVEVAQATRVQSRWIRVATGGKTKVTIHTDRFVSGGVYVGNRTTGNFDIEFTPDANNEVCTAIYESAVPEPYLYVCLTFSYGKINVSAEGEDNPDAIEHVFGDTEPIEVYNLSGTRQTVMQKGISILRASDGTVRKVIVK